MARHLSLWGSAYSTAGDVSIELDFNTVAVSGTVVTTNATTPTQPTVLQKIFSFEVPDEFNEKTDQVFIRVKAIDGDIFVAGFGDFDKDDFFGSNPGQLKSNISYNGGEAYNVTDADLLAAGITVAEGGSPGEFHLNCVESAIVTFDYDLPKYYPPLDPDSATEI